MMEHRTLRSLAMANHFMVFVSSVIVTGVISHFLKVYSFRNAHVIYQEVVATITLALSIVAMALPFIHGYKGYLLPVNLIMSYLWMTSFIFSAQDWAGGRCPFNGPLAKCGLKKTVIAFNFLALFFLLCNIVAEGLLWRQSRVEAQPFHTKERPVSDATAGSVPETSSHV
ncbi:hypothetical protein JDV02_001917 [Purpureocillium takamizusanense]|uniref:MARVEL domain-containing protein n=1 Tax=Purpureocillium takamizusanense TaxID=2060973 RepID=A0A9Q8V6Y1_9HYPO|nr:uncharacterized protein JDV02_001917 [Purpureocillium takamizusanense]UNI15380.1 hypothetical protein JDV02_001917 [Purpureocillium takamizusanense]